MNDFLSSFLNKISKKVSRRKTTKWNKNQIKLDLLKLEERLVPAPNLVVPTTTSGAPLGFLATSNLAFSGALDIELLDTPNPASTGSFSTTVDATAGTASATASGAAVVTGSGTNALTIAGNLADVNATLNSLTYTNSTTGAASLVVTARDSAGTPLTDTKTIFVNAANATLAPTITTTLADVAYTAETNASPVARPTIAVVVNDPQGATGVVVTTTNDNPALVNSISVAGTYPNFTLAITTKTGITGTAVVTVKVSDGTNFTTKSFKVTVTPSPYTLSVETLAGRTSGSGSTGYTDGTGSSATFTNPRGATADNRGLIYVQDGNLIRSINTSGVVTTLAGGTANTTRVDGVGTAAGIPVLGSSTYAAMKVSPDNNWLYFMNGGWLRKMGIDPSDTANYKNVTSVMAFTGSPAGGGLVFSSDGTKIFQVFDLKIKRFDLTTNTISNLDPDGNAANNVSAAWMIQGPNNTAFLRYHPGYGTTAYFGGLFRVDLNTGAFTRLANNPLNALPLHGGPAYNPDTNEILVDTNNSSPMILDASTGALKYTLPAATIENRYTDGVGSSFDATDAITFFGGIYYLSQGGPASTTAANIRAVKPSPGLFNPGSVTFTEGQTNYFDNTALEKIGVSANGSASIAYTITALYGTLDVASVTGLTGVSGRGTQSLSFTGSEADLIAALATLAYTPNTGFINASTTGTQITGAPLETLTATATGTSAAGIGMGTNTATTNVLVKAINNNPRIITALPDRVYLVDSVITTEKAINFTIADADTAAGSFINNATTGARIVATSDNPNLILASDIVEAIGGTGNARTFTVKHQANITGVANITITIADVQGNQSTYTFKVTVKTGPSYYWGTLTNTAGSSQITYDSNGDLIALDYANGAVRRITPQGASTLLKSGFTTPYGVAIDANKNLYVSDGDNSIKKVPYNSLTNTYGTTTILAPGVVTGEILISPDGTTLYGGKFYQIVKVNIATGAVSVLAGSGTSGSVDGTGLNASFSYARYLAWDNNGNILAAEANSNVRLVTLAGVVTTLPLFANAPSLSPHQNTIVQTRDGNYVGMVSAPVVRVSTPDGNSTVVSGGSGSSNGLNRVATFSSQRGGVATPDGKVYISDIGVIRVGTLYPSLLNPGTQSTLDGVRLAFSSANLAQLGAFANDTDMSFVRLPITYTLSAKFGKLDFNNVAVPAGVTVTFSADRKSVTLSGLEAAINTYMLNLGYTPDANYINANMSGGALASGAIAPEVLSFSVVTANNTNNPVTGSLNILVKAADLKPKIITALPDRQYYVENATTTETAFTFTIADADTATFTNNATSGARITATCDNLNLFSAADLATAIGGSGANRTFTVKHQANITGVANVTITINDGALQNTYTFKVTVVPTPSYYWNILAGSSAGTAGTTNATGTSASFSGPTGLVKDSQGNYFVTDTTNNLIRKITPQGVVTTFAGFGGTGAFLDGAGTAAKFNSPQGLAIDSANNLYVADFGNNRIRKIDTAGNVTTIAGTGTASSLDGAALSATLRGPTGIAVDSTGTVYWADKTTSVIRKLQGGQVTTIAGSSGLTGTTDGTGNIARFNLPSFLTINNAGNLVVNDSTNLSYRQVTPAGVVTTLFSYTSGATAVGVDAQGNIYAGLSSNTLSLVSSFDTTTIMGTGTAGSAIAVNTAATVGSTRQMVFLSDGTIVIADFTRNNIRVGAPIPSLMNPGKQIVLADQLLTFDNVALEGLGIQSNGYPEPLSITLTVTKGVFSLSQTTGLTFATGDGTNDTTMTFTGSMANINSALTGLVYNFDEVTYPTIIADTLTISTPYTVGGVTSTISQVVPIQIVKPPVITTVADKLVNLGSAISAATFTVTDADTAANALTYTITSSNTALVANSGLVRTGGTGATGTVAPANAANSLAITAVTGRTGTAIITISVFDGAITTATTFSVTVSPIVGAPDLMAASDTGTSTTDNLTSDTTPTFAISIGGSSGIQVGDVVAIYNGTTKIGEAVVTAADITAGSIQVTTSALADGNYSNITSSVVFGTTRGAISAPLSPTLVIDATAPSANSLPDLTSASDTGASSTDNVTNNTTPSFTIPITGSGAIAGDKVELYSGTTLIGTVTLTASDITNGSATVVVSPALAAGTYSDIKYRLADTAGNTSSFSGSMSPALVIDLSAPTLVTLNPADDATNLVPPTTLVMTLSEALSKGTGSIIIKKTSDNSVVETFNVATSGRVMVSNSTVTITPSVTLAYGTGYYVTVANTALLDLAGNAYAGLANTTDWNFTTLSSPPAPTGVDLVSTSDSGSSSTDDKTNKTDITLDVALANGSQVGDVIKLYDGTTVVGTITLTANDITAGKVSFNLVSQTDGTHSYKATLSNNAGESAPTSVLTTIIDTSLPGAPTITPIVSPSSNTTPTLSGTAEAGATVTVVIDGTSVTVIADNSGNWTYPIPAALAQGSHTVVVTQTDSAGNIGVASNSASFVVDTTAPIPTTFSPADGSTVSKPSVLSITFNEAIALGSTGTITIFDDTNNTSQVISLPNANITVSGNTLTIVPTTALIGGVNYHVQISSGAIKDLAGNAYAGISNAIDWNFTTNSAPSSPSGVDLHSSSDSGTSNSDNKTNATTLNFDVPIPAGASVGDVIKLYDGTTEVGSITIIDSTMLNAGTVTFNLTGVTGIHSYTSTLTNTGSGLTSSPSPALVVDVNTTLPSAPVITPLATTKNQTPTISGTAPANSTVTLTITPTAPSGTPITVTVTTDANGNWNYTPTTPLTQGTYVLNATATDVYGNISPVSAPTNLVIDTTAPTKPIITGIGPDNGVSSTDKITNANVLTIAGTAEPNSLVTIYDNGVMIGTATTGANGAWTLSPTPTLADGSNRFSANATDSAGNKSVNADSYTMVVDASAPTAPVINSLPSPNGDNTPTISGTGEPGAVVTINATNGSPIGTAVVDANGNWSFTPTTPISDGTTAFTATQKDTAGNNSATSNTVTSVIDTTAPNAPAINSLSTINSATPAITGTAEPGSTIKLYNGTTLVGTATADSNGNWTITPSPALNEGTNNLIATATDPSGNISPTSSPVVVVVDTVAPIATSFSPATGSSTSSIFENLVINFSEAVALGSSGTIELRDSNGVLIESFSIGSNRLSLSGNSLTIDPTANLTLGTGYYVTMTAGTIKDLAGNAFAGVTNNSDWAFTTSSLAIPPAPSGVNLQPGSDTGSSNTDNITSDNTPTFDIALNPSGLNVGDVVHLYDNGVEVGSVILTAADIAAGKVSITSSALADGVHSLTSKIEDANGTFSAASPALSVSIITQPPTQAGTPDLAAGSDTGSSSTDNITSIKTPTFNGTGTPGETVSLFVDGVLAGVGVVDSNGNYSITASSPIADGVHAITTQNTNIAGISGAVSAPLSLTVDSTPPATPTTPADMTSATDTGRANSDNITSDTTPDFSGNGLTPGNTVVIYVDGQPAGSAVVDANGNWTATVSPALSDGSHTVTYLVNDLAGNASEFAPTMSITVDTAVPAKPSVPTLDPASDTGLSATDGITSDNTPTINGTGGTPGFDVILKDGNGNTIGIAIVAADGTWSITPTTSLLDGAYNFTASYTSISGVAGPASDPISVVIDTVAPSAPAAPTISTINPSATPGHTNSTTPVFEGAGLTPGNLVELFDGSTKVGSAIVGANGNYQIISSTLADGAHSFTVKVTDAAGNTSGASSSTSLTIDTRVPGSPTTPDLTPATDTGSSNTDNITNNNTPVFQGVVDVNSSLIAGDFVEIYSGNTLVGVGVVVSNNGVLSWSVTVGTTASGTALGATTLSEGTQAISAKFRTLGGTASASSQALTVVVDTIAPAAPSGAPDLAASSDTGTSSTDNLTNDTTPTFTGTGGVPGDTVNLYAGSTLVGTATVGPDGSYSVSASPALTDGPYSFTTKYADPAGNLSSASLPINVTIDSTPPAVPPTPDLIATADTGASNFDNLTSENRPTFEGFGTTGDTIKIYVDGVLAGTTTVDANGNWSITTNSIADGVHQITTQAIDPAGNASAQSTPLVLTIDSSAPNSPIFTTTSGPTSNAQPPISGTGEPGSSITLYDGTTPIGTAIVNANGSWSITPSSPLAEGTHTFTTTATDGAGNISLPSSPIAVTIDTSNPLPPVIASVSQDTGNPSDKITSDNTLTITGNAEPGTTITVYDSSTGSPVAVGTVVVGADGTYSVTTNPLTDGSHPLSITSTDSAGNESQPAAVGTYIIDTGTPTAPTFGSVSQDTGNPSDKITSDNTLTVTGLVGSAEPGTTITIYDSSSGSPVAVGTAVVAQDGSYSVTTSVLSNGNHPLSITATDAAGNQSSPTSLGIWSIDSTAPNAPSFGSVSQDTGISATDKITSDNTLTISGAAGSAEPGTTITVYDTSSGTPVAVGTAVVDANGSYSVTTSALSDGNHPLSITATDVAGNQSSPTSLGIWTIDTAVPTSPVVTSVSDDTGRSNSDKITSDNTLTVTGNAEPNSLVTIYAYIDNSDPNIPDTIRVVVGTGYADANGNYAVTTNPLADNALNEKYVLSVTATDPAGMESPETSIGAWAISTSIPNPPVVTSVSQDTGSSSTDKLTNDTTLTVTGTGTPGTTITIYDGTTPVGTGLVDANGNYSVTTSPLADGAHALSASATNPFGFEGLSTQLGTWNVDTLDPIQPTLTANNGLPLVSGLANSAEPGSTVSVVIGGATYTTIVDGNGAWSINLATAIPTSGSAPALATGTFPISVFSTDAAGNSTTPVVSNLVVTTIGQPAPSITSNPSTSDTTPLISGNSEIGSTVTVTILDANNNVIATYSNVPTNSNGTWALDLQTAIPSFPLNSTTPIPALVNGTSYNLSATATDASGLFTSVLPTTQKLVIDTTAPNRPVITSPAITNDTTPLFTGTAEPGTVIELTIKRANGTSVTIYQTVTSPIDPNNPNAPGTWSIDFSQISPSAGFLNDLADGNYIVEVVAIDAAFNRSTAATHNPFIVDTVAPAVPVITSPSLTNDNTPVLTGTAEPGSTVTVVIAGFTYTTTAASPSGAWSVDLGTAIPVGGSTPITALTDGINTVTVTATDPAGNTSAPATQNLRVDTTPPAVPQITSSDKNKDTTPVITGLAEPGSTVAVTINGATFSTIVGPNGSWSVDLGTAIPNGGTTPITPLVDGSYPISVTATDAAGNTSAPATQTLAIDTSAPISPTITSPALTNQVPPTVTGTAEPLSTITLTINGATYTTPVDANGNWTLNTATATPTSGTLGAFTDGPYPISVYSTDSTQNQSGTSTQTLTVDLTPPVIVGALASFGVNLNLDESNANAIVSVNISGIEDGRTVTVTLNGLTYTGTVFNGKVDITIPAAILSNLADGSSQTLTVTTTDLAGNAATPYQVPFTVDKTGPARPSFVSITSTSTDPNPADQFTGVVNPTVVISGQAGQTIVIHGPNGIVDPSNYTVVDNNGLYTITFTTNQTSGNYQVNLQDVNGNENANGPGAQNFFTIDSIPVLYDMPNKRSTAQGSTFGNLGVKNTLNGQTFNVPQQADNTWIDLDGETLTFGLAGSTVVETDLSNNPTMIEASINGASLKIDPRTGAYTYTPVSNTDRLDTFFVTIRDTSGNQTQLKLMFNSRDTLDRDGIVSISESVLAGLVNQSGNATNLLGDLNQDGLPDSQQNSVSTLAWRKEADFQIATDSNTAANTDPTAIICIVVNATAFDPATTTTLTQLMGNVDPLAQILQVSVSGLSSVAADESKYFKPWDIMNFSVESLVSTGLNDVNATRDGTQIQVSIDISKANIPMGGSGFSLYRKFVSANIISDYADAGITLTDLDGNIITTAGWFDYTQRTPGGDGAIGKDFNNDGKIDAIIITLTDNAFGDDSPIKNTVVDPITPTGNFPTPPGGSNPAVPTPPGSNPPAPAPTSFAATGTSTGSVPGTTVNIYPTSTTTPSMVLVPFENWQGEVRIARADINADGNLETIATMGEGGLPILRVFDGLTGAQTMEIQVYDQAFNGGIFVAIGDLGNDGILDIVTGAGNGGGPHVKIFNSITGAETSSFMAYDINFRGGISVAVGDIDGSGFAAIVTGAGPGGGPHVKVFNGTDHSLIKQFMAYASNFSGGVYVAVGDYLSDGKYEIITGAGAGGGPHIKIWDYETLNLDGQTMAFTDFTKDNGEVIDVIFNGGVRVALADANGDNVLDILAGAGPSGGPRVEVFVGFRLELLMDFFSGDKNDGRGVFVSQ